LIEIGSKTAEKNSAQTDRQTDATKIMDTWPWTNEYLQCKTTQLTLQKSKSHLGSSIAEFVHSVREQRGAT